MERARLITHIDKSGAQVILICAPAGFGKTTLMQQLRHQFESHGMATIWLRVDSSDDELGRFVQSFLAAVHFALPEFALPNMANDQPGPGRSVQGLAADLLDRISLSDAAIAFFLDDLELITDQETRGFLQRLLADLGPRHQVIIGSRTPAALLLGRLRAHGQLLELNQEDLRFTPEETVYYLERQSLTEPAALQSLQQRTQGWPAALQLAAITLNANRKRGADWLEGFSGSTESIAEYLAQEVLHGRTARQRSFLMKSSVLGEFCAEMCDAVFAREDSGEMIAQLLRDNLFLTSIDAEQRWYRYHPLFADFLRVQLQRNAPNEMHRLHRGAALWAADHGQMNEAVVHALAAPDYALAADLLETSAMEAVRFGSVADTARAIEMLPDAEVIRRPALLRAAAFAAIFAHRYTAAARFIEVLQRSDAAGKGGADDEITAMRLMLLAWTDRMPELLATVTEMRTGAPRSNPFTTGLISNASAYCNIALGRYVEAERDLAQAREACEPIHALYVLSYSVCFNAAIELILGNTASARMLLDNAMNRTVLEGHRYGSAAAVIATHLCELLYEVNELDACEALLTDYLPLVVETGLPDHLIVLHRIASRVHLLRGRPEACQATLAQLAELGTRRGIRRMNAAAWLEKAYISLRCGDPDGSRRSLALGGDASMWQSFGDFQLYASEIDDPFISGVRLKLVLGQGDQALAQLQAASRMAESLGRRRRTLRMRFLLAQVLEGLGQRRQASEAFDAAVAEAHDRGLVRTLADDSWVSESLVKRAAAAGDPHEAGLLREIRPPADGARPNEKRTPPGDSSSVAFRLTNREVQILRLLWKGHSNKAIARELFLTENTIETHLRRIYEKLGTRNRTQAVAMAREAGAI